MTEVMEAAGEEPAAEADSLRPFYFYVVFWGEQFRDYFLELCLPSLLSPNNIPALANRKRSRLLIAAPRADWEAIQQEPIFRRLKSHMEPVWLEMAVPGPDDSKMLVMSKGQKAAVEMAFRDAAYGVTLAPDLILSDGSVAELQRLALEGKKLVLIPAMRFSMDPIVDALKARGLMRPGQPLTLPARELMGIALENIHSEFLRYDWNSPYFADFPVVCYWRVPDGSGIVLHSFSWGPMLLDYGSLTEHHAETLDDWTLDGDYIYQNFREVSPEDDDVHVITDSDSICFVTMTSESDWTFYPLKKERLKSLRWLGEWTKGYFLDKAFKNDVFDDLKRQLFLIPIKFHKTEVSEVWDDVENASQRIFMKYIEAFLADRKLLVHVEIDEKLLENNYAIFIPRFEIIVLLAERLAYRIYLSSLIVFLGMRFIGRLFLAYCRIFGEALTGNMSEWARIRRHLSIVSDKIRTLPGMIASFTPRFFRSRADTPVLRFRPDRSPAAYYVIMLPKAPIALVADVGRRAWNVVYCLPRRYWNFLSPYGRKLWLAASGDRAERQRIKRRAGLILSGIVSRLRSRA